MATELARVVGTSLHGVDFWSLRSVERRDQSIQVRQNVLQPVVGHAAFGVFITVMDRGGLAYAGTSDLSPEGLKAAALRARDWAHATADSALFATHSLPRVNTQGRYRSRVTRAFDSVALGDKIALLRECSRKLKRHERIVDWAAGFHCSTRRVTLITSAGGEIEQELSFLTPELVAVANEGTETQRRTFGYDTARQGGWEQLARVGFSAAAERVAEDALALLEAPECASARTDVLLMPGQMMLQIHESIGHPLELDRILGDERNYAGGSFVTLDMFGSYRYGSELLDVTFDPNRHEQLASYAFDDDGAPAERQYLIRGGILRRPLGGSCSQVRSGIAGVACGRASDWNRPPIDRMANLNLEPGSSTFTDLVGSIERGVLMDTNRSWSIDDHRNKFQFGCEYGRIIEDGEIKGLVKNPGYRGVSATFWRSLSGVGDHDTFRVMGVGTCGKGEPNQAMHVGHAAPACVFKDVEIFGGG